jgi:mono/diheme cytochrome c family protein
MRTPWTAVLSITLALMMLPALCAAESAVDAAAAAKGQVTYTRYCVACHGTAGKGDGSLAPDLRVPVPDLTSLTSRSGGSYPYDRVVRIIKSGEVVRGHGTVDMPAWGDAFKMTKGTEEASADAAVRNLTHYIHSIQKPAR